MVHEGTKESITISSSSGRESFRLSFESRKDALVSIFRASIAGSFWDRQKPLERAELVRDFEVALPQVALSSDALDALRRCVDTWLETRADQSCVLSPVGATDQILSISIGADSRLLWTAERPAFVVRFERGATMKGDWAFLVDQSCLRCE